MRTSFYLSLCTVLGALGCSDLKQDAFTANGGISPDPTAIVEGTILYAGPRPSCVYNDNRQPQRVIGNVVLTMYEYENPPPPEGSAEAAVNLLAVSGDELFELEDCTPFGALPNYSERITRSTMFRWPRVVLTNKEADYQIRGFYDYDEDMIPFYSITRLPTAGDVVGAALNDVQDASKGLFKLKLPAVSAALNGVVRGGLTVALGNVTWTERPAFRLNPQRRLAADAPFAPVFSVVDGVPVPNAPASLRSFRRLTCDPGDMSENCGLTLQRFSTADQPKLAAATVQLALGGESYAFFAAPVDLKTVAPERVDTQTPDGIGDPHPLLGGLGVPWFTPMVVFQRMLKDPAAIAYERSARIPRVVLVGSILIDDAKRPLKSSFHEPPIAVPPIAAVELIAGRPECRVPYFPPGTSPQLTSGRVGRCAELPTGYYGVSALGGIAGGQLQMASDFPATSDSPMSVRGGRYSGQSWSIPNELGNVQQVGGPENVIADQGFDGTFVVHDPSVESGACPAQPPFPICQDDLLLVESEFGGLDVQTCLPRRCCEAVAHLCNVPPCAMIATSAGRVSASPDSVVENSAGGPAVPNCVPFEVPAQCCGG